MFLICKFYFSDLGVTSLRGASLQELPLDLDGPSYYPLVISWSKFSRFGPVISQIQQTSIFKTWNDSNPITNQLLL